MLLSAVIIESIANGSTTFRTVLFFIITVALFASLGYYIILPGIKRVANSINIVTLAHDAGTYFPKVKDELANALQLYSTKVTTEEENPLIEAAFDAAYKKSSGIDFTSIVSFKKAKRNLLIALATVLLFVVSTTTIHALGSSLHRIINFRTSFVPPARYTFNITPGNSSISKGDDLLVTVKVNGPKIANIVLHYKDASQAKFETITLDIDSTHTFSYKFYALRNNLTYFVSAEEVLSDEFNVEVTDKPIIKTFGLLIAPPAYTGIKSSEQRDNGSFTAIVGTSISLSLESNKALSEAILLFDDSIKVPLNISDTKANGFFSVRKTGKYQIIIKDNAFVSNLYPITYSITSFQDESPAIEMIHPNKNVDLSVDQRIDLAVNIKDDYGFSHLTLKYRISASKSGAVQKDFTSVNIPINNSTKEQYIEHIFNLSPLLLAPEDVVVYYLEVADNDVISGPKYAKTGLFSARVPSVDELFSAAKTGQKELENEMNDVLKKAEEVKKDIDNIDKNLKQDSKEISFEEKAKIEQTIDKFNKLQDKTAEVSKKLDDTQKKLQENNLLSKETLQKYMEMQKLFNELNSDEMKKAMERLQNSLQNMNRKQIQNEMQNFKLDEESFKQSIERTVNLLKRVQAEQKMDELTKRASDLESKQERLENEASKADLKNQQQQEKFEKAQEEITKELDKMREAMKDLKNLMQDMKDMPKEQMDALQKQFDEQKNQELSKEAGQQMKAGEKSQAQKKQKQLKKNMQQMAKGMQQMQQQMQQQNRQQVMNEMMKVINNLVELSKTQEELKMRTARKNQANQLTQETREQDELRRNLEKTMRRLAEISQKTFAITPEMGKELGQANMEINQALQQMQNNNGTSASQSQGKAMGNLNAAATLMKEGMEAMMDQQGGSGGGMMSLMQQMGKLSGQQMSLNNMTQQMMNMNGNQLTQEQMGQMERLAQQQELIRKSIEQLEKEARQQGKSKSMPANLDKINKEMQEVVNGMKTGTIDDQLVQKQEKILSKMLDAQRSVNERDFEEERKSNAGKKFDRNSPKDLALDKKKKNTTSSDLLKKAENEGFSKDFDDLNRRYFESLNKN